MKEFFYMLFLCEGFGLVIYFKTETIPLFRNKLLKSVCVKDSFYTTNATILSDALLRQYQASITNPLSYNNTVCFTPNKGYIYAEEAVDYASNGINGNHTISSKIQEKHIVQIIRNSFYNN